MNKPVKIYFVSDLHLGTPNKEETKKRELKFVRWLDMIKQDATELYLLGDVFDMWFEYKRVIPKGFTRLFGKLAEISDAGIPVHFFTGNHDMWVFDYFTEELGFRIYREPITRAIAGKKFFIGHGDGLGSGDKGYKFIKKAFSSKINQWLFARLHPNFALGLAEYFSGKSRAANAQYDEIFTFEEEEILVQFSKKYLEKETIDYFIFGHRHLKLDIQLNDSSRYINLGEWVKGSSYGVFDGEELILKEFL